MLKKSYTAQFLRRIFLALAGAAERMYQASVKVERAAINKQVRTVEHKLRVAQEHVDALELSLSYAQINEQNLSEDLQVIRMEAEKRNKELNDA